MESDFKLVEGIPRQTVVVSTDYLTFGGQRVPIDKNTNLDQFVEMYCNAVREDVINTIAEYRRELEDGLKHLGIPCSPSDILVLADKPYFIPGKTSVYVHLVRPETEKEYNKNLARRTATLNKKNLQLEKKKQEELDLLKSLANKHNVKLYAENSDLPIE